MSKARVNPRPRSYVLYPSDGHGPGLSDVAAQLRATPEITLLQEGTSALLVKGGPGAVRSFTLGLPGWSAEENKKVRSAG